MSDQMQLFSSPQVPSAKPPPAVKTENSDFYNPMKAPACRCRAAVVDRGDDGELTCFMCGRRIGGGL